MPKFPEPPAFAVLQQVKPDIKILRCGVILWRVYLRGGTHPTLWSVFRRFGPTNGRFDQQLPDADGNPCLQDRAILYAALQGPTCLAEVFQESRVIDRRARDPWLAAFRLQHELQLLDLTGTWPTRAGASMAINTGSRFRAQRWSRVIYDAYPCLHGLYYPSSMHANQAAIALYERASDTGAMPAQPLFHRSLSDPSLLTALRNVATDLGYLVI